MPDVLLAIELVDVALVPVDPGLLITSTRGLLRQVYVLQKWRGIGALATFEIDP